MIHSQYQGGWCHGDARCQGVSNRDIYYAELDWFGPRKLKVKQQKYIRIHSSNYQKQYEDCTNQYKRPGTTRKVFPDE